MPSPSPAAAVRGSPRWSSPGRKRLSALLSEDRHSEAVHQEILTTTHAERQRVNETAVRVFEEHTQREHIKRIQEEEARVVEQQRREEERIRREESLRREQERLRALRVKTVPQLPPEPPTAEPPTSRLKTDGAASLKAPDAGGTDPSRQKSSSPFAKAPDTSTNGMNHQLNGIKPTQPLDIQQPQALQAAKLKPTTSPFSQPFSAGTAFLKPTTSEPGRTTSQITPKQPPAPEKDRYLEIHQNLKRLRASLAQEIKTSPALKARMGDMRRELRKNMGQLVGEKGGNKKQIATISALLNESLSGAVPSTLVDPSDYVTDKRGPVEGAVLNNPQLPSLFIYLLNQFAKAIINQFINACGVSPKSADPLGVIAAMVFSNKNYLWRGKTLIDILMAKFRFVCPVLFGYRGSEKTEQGRLNLGWRKDGAGWAPEQQHLDRMKGLGAGYAAISLRDFSKSPNTNPWPPSHYWTSFAKIVNTPPAEVSNTQCVVLRAIIETHEERFMTFYGSAAIAALRKALLDFPAKAQIRTPGVSGLNVLAEILKQDFGLEL